MHVELGGGVTVTIDLVNLRAETYADHSRIPEMVRLTGFSLCGLWSLTATGQRFGTPLEDARRRDLTINALFYNINTTEIEDLTGHGLADLANGRIRTPLPPEQTFLDDPLRLLRAVRFANRFDFRLDPELIQAARLPNVHVRSTPDEACRGCVIADRLHSQDALEHKVSRERYLKEIDGMLNGTVSFAPYLGSLLTDWRCVATARDPFGAFALLLELNLFGVVFSPAPETISADSYSRQAAVVLLRMARHVTAHCATAGWG
jgi:tRNA nucleotidyltransferase/poly(A) polymerase